jgi:hypothetical protein
MMNASDVMMTDENIKGHFGSVLANSLRQKNASIASPHASSQRASRELFWKARFSPSIINNEKRVLIKHKCERS